MRNTLTDSETDELYRRYEKITEHKNVSREGLRIWYNGYHTFRGESVYNPRSVVFALTNNNLASYWTSSEFGVGGFGDSIVCYEFPRSETPKIDM